MDAGHRLPPTLTTGAKRQWLALLGIRAVIAQTGLPVTGVTGQTRRPLRPRHNCSHYEQNTCLEGYYAEFEIPRLYTPRGTILGTARHDCCARCAADARFAGVTIRVSGNRGACLLADDAWSQRATTPCGEGNHFALACKGGACARGNRAAVRAEVALPVRKSFHVFYNVYANQDKKAMARAEGIVTE